MAVPKSATEILGYEYDFLAVDARGHVALFCTAGRGFAPEAFLRDTEGHADGIDALLGLPATTTSRELVGHATQGMCDEWIRAAERGLHVYDFEWSIGAYELVAAPVDAVDIQMLPAAVSRAAREIRCPFWFGEDHITIEQLGKPRGSVR